jgi:hypothetical protein
MGRLEMISGSLNFPVEFNDLIFDALDTGIGCIEKMGGPLPPFVAILDRFGKRESKYFANPVFQYELSLEQARKYVEESAPILSVYAIVYDGFITLKNRKWEAVFVEAGMRDREMGVLLCQRYEQKGLFKKRFVRVGNPGRVEQPPSRIFQKSP